RQALHQRAGSEPVGAMIREVCFADRVQARNRRHQVVIHPQATHRVVDGWVDSHWNFVWILAGDAFIHVEEIAISLADALLAETVDGVGEVEVNAQAAFADSAAIIAHSLRVARRYVTRNEIAEAGILSFEIVIPRVFRDPVRRSRITFLFRNPNPAVIPKRFAHECELRLIIATDGDAGGVNLRETRIREGRAAFMSAPDGRTVGAFGVRRQIENISITARSKYHGVGQVRFDFPGDQISSDNAPRLPFDHNEIEHLRPGKHGYFARTDLTKKCLI